MAVGGVCRLTVGHITLACRARVLPPPIFGAEVVPHAGVVFRQAADGRSDPGVVDRRGGRAVRRVAGRARVLELGRVSRRVPLLVAFGEFAKARGASAVEDLPGMSSEFVAERVASYRGVRRCGNVETDRQVAREVRRAGRAAAAAGRCRGFSVAAGGIVAIRSLTRFPGSSGTWRASAGFARRRSAVPLSPRAVRGVSGPDRGQAAERALAAAGQRVRRRARRRWAGQGDRCVLAAGCCACSCATRIARAWSRAISAGG